MTHTHTIAELRTAVAAGTEPSPCLARRTAAVLAGGHARFLVRIADGRGAPEGWQRALIRNMRYSFSRRPIDLDRTQDLRAEGRMRRATVGRSTGSRPVQRRDLAGSSRYCLRCVPRQVDILAAACGDARAWQRDR